MKKILTRCIAVIVVVLLVLVLARNLIVPPIIRSGIRAATGLNVVIGSMDIGLFKTYLNVARVELLNPPQFEDRVMVNIPLIHVNYQLGALLRKKVHLRSVTFAMQDVLIVKNADGSFNIDALKALQDKQRPPAEPKPEMKKIDLQIDELAIRIGTVTFKDYSDGGAPRVQQISLNFDERFTHVTDPHQLTIEIIMRIMTRAGIVGLLNLGMLSLPAAGVQQAAEVARGVVSGVATNSGGDAGKALQDAADQLRKVLPFGR